MMNDTILYSRVTNHGIYPYVRFYTMYFFTKIHSYAIKNQSQTARG